VVFLTALDPDRPWHGVMVGKGDKDTIAVVTIGPLGDTAAKRLKEAHRRLGDLLELYHTGMVEPLPMFTASSYAWQAAEQHKRYGDTRSKWEPGWNTDGERAEPAIRMLFPDLATVDDLEVSDFPRYARRLWAPILETSTVDAV
jgi:exonuclease V gamma subunit